MIDSVFFAFFLKPFFWSIAFLSHFFSLNFIDNVVASLVSCVLFLFIDSHLVLLDRSVHINMAADRAARIMGHPVVFSFKLP